MYDVSQPVMDGIFRLSCSFLSPQIDSIDPAFAPATGTPETGGWTTRELRAILRGLDGIPIVSADIVEVAPAYDTNAELTTMAAADVRTFMSSGCCILIFLSRLFLRSLRS